MAARGIIILLVLCVALASARQGFGPGEQDWGFVDVRTGAHMFYWLYYTTAKVDSYTDRPLAIWLQGGPGSSSTAYGNFEELGPLDLYGNYREHTWVKDMNVLFIDNPVGAGFSYVDSILRYATTNNRIALDLVEFMKGFYALHPEFEDVPLHIFCESYGGKMAPEFALELYYAIQRGEIRSNLKAVVLGDPWTSPVDSTLSWGPFLLQMAIVDHDGYDKIMDSARKVESYVNNENWSLAFTQWSTTQGIVLRESQGVDFYDVLKPVDATKYERMLARAMADPIDFAFRTSRDYSYDIDENREQMLTDLMRINVTQALGIPSNVKWDSQGYTTFMRLSGDFMKPAVHTVEELLDNTTVEVGVLSGQLDLICSTPGTINWINNMTWSYKNEYEAATRSGINVNRILEGYEKGARNFTVFWVNRAGHMVPADNANAMDYILRKYTKYDQIDEEPSFL